MSISSSTQASPIPIPSPGAEAAGRPRTPPALALAAAAAVVAIAALLLSTFALRPGGRPSTAAFPGPAAAPGAATRTISTEGTAEQRVAPDLATIQLTVITRAASPAQSQASNGATQRAVVTAVRAAGVDSRSINPAGLDITEDTHELNNQLVTEYVVKTEVYVDTRDLATIGSLLQKAFAAGATTGRVEFKTTRLRELRDRARAEAVKAARDKARDLAAGVDATIGRVVAIGEGSTNYWAPQPLTSNSAQNAVAVQGTSPVGAMAEEFGGGMIRVSATVSTTFEMH